MLPRQPLAPQLQRRSRRPPLPAPLAPLFRLLQELQEEHLPRPWRKINWSVDRRQRRCYQRCRGRQPLLWSLRPAPRSRWRAPPALSPTLRPARNPQRWILARRHLHCFRFFNSAQTARSSGNLSVVVFKLQPSGVCVCVRVCVWLLLCFSECFTRSTGTRYASDQMYNISARRRGCVPSHGHLRLHGTPHALDSAHRGSRVTKF